MNTLANLFDWFAGNGHYHTLRHCMGNDVPWIIVTVVLDLAVACGYVQIALHWSKNERHLPPIPAKRALRNMRNIFAFCGICGYIFIPIKMFWPAWRLYDMFMAVLVYFTWKYAWGARDLKVIYAEMGRSKQLAEDLERSREESKRKTFFLNAISHDLRTPLNGLLLQANLAEIGAASKDPETVATAVAEIKASAKATAELLNGFLEYARLDWANERNVISRFNLAEVVRQAVVMNAAAAGEKRIELIANVPSELSVETDRAKLERVVLNLVSNAVKFTDKGSVRVEVEQTGRALEIHVIDSGVGIDPTTMDHVFDEFFQAHNSERDRRKGFGLGLNIARRLARQIGGDITCASALGRGSRFSLQLPEAKVGGAGPDPAPAGEPASAAARTAAVVVVG